MAQSASLRGQTKSRPCTKKGLGVIMVIFWRQFMIVLASNLSSFDANMQGWPQEGKGLATGGFTVGHRADRSLTGIGRDLGTLRKGIGPVPEMFGGLSPCAEAWDKRVTTGGRKTGSFLRFVLLTLFPLAIGVQVNLRQLEDERQHRRVIDKARHRHPVRNQVKR